MFCHQIKKRSPKLSFSHARTQTKQFLVEVERKLLFVFSRLQVFMPQHHCQDSDWGCIDNKHLHAHFRCRWCRRSRGTVSLHAETSSFSCSALENVFCVCLPPLLCSCVSVPLKCLIKICRENVKCLTSVPTWGGVKGQIRLRIHTRLWFECVIASQRHKKNKNPTTRLQE